MNRFAATFFIGIAPPAIISVILFKMLHLFSHHSVIGLDAAAMTTLCKFGILFTWGFAAWWFIMAIIIILYYIKSWSCPMPCRGGPLPSRRGALRFIRCRLERVAICDHSLFLLAVGCVLAQHLGCGLHPNHEGCSVG